MIATAIGLMGPVLFVFAYAMISLGKWHNGMMRPHVLNLLGAICVVISLLKHFNLPVFLLECAWGAISLYGIWQAWRAAKSA